MKPHYHPDGTTPSGDFERDTICGAFHSQARVNLAEAQKALDKLTNDTPGGVAMAWIDGTSITFLSAGTYDSEDPRPITPDTQFHIASITKVFTALLLVRSERQGKVNRNDSAGKYLLPLGDPDSDKLAKITLLLLATHCSGLPREPTSIPRLLAADCYPFAQYTREQLIDAFRTDGVGATCDLIMSYSNFGFSVLGQALAEAWQGHYSQLLQEQVLQPLGLGRTTMALLGSPPTFDLAPGHVNDQRISHWSFDAAMPACGLCSSVRELAKLLCACLVKTDGPMHADLIETMKPLRQTDYGLIGIGWGITGEREKPTYSHSGGIGGYRSFLGFTPARHRGVVILTNTTADVGALGCRLLEVAIPTPAVPIVPKAADFVGWYPLSPAFAIRVAEQNGALYFQATGEPGVWLKPRDSDRFVVPAAMPAELSFQRDDRGEVVSLIWHTHGQRYQGFRRDLPSPPKTLSLSTATLDEYVGQFLVKEGFVITVRHANTGLMVQATGQREAAIFASAKDEFFYKVLEARITFVRRSTGQISRLILRQRGREVIGEKIS